MIEKFTESTSTQNLGSEDFRQAVKEKLNELIEASNRQDRVIAQLMIMLDWKAVLGEDAAYYEALRRG